MSEHPSIGLAGLGLMGGGIAKRLLEAEYPLTVLPGPRGTNIDALKQAGATVVRSPAELTASCTVILTCLPSSREVEAVVGGEAGLMATAAPDLLHIDLTSGNPTSTLALASAYRGRGIHLLDAAMAGMPEQAAKGEITLMVGAEPDILRRARPILEAFSKKIVRTGDVGTGQRTKLIMSFIGMAIANATAEALLVARSLDVDIEALRNLVGDTGMNSNTFQSMALAALDGNVSRRKLTIGNALKDMSYFVDMINEARLETTLAPATLNALERAARSGNADNFVPALTAILFKRNALELACQQTSDTSS
jgi:3-hydroxyisobutyrate dehydrogenase-like beta-hydroxyacid dehydrogenase